MNLIKMEFFLWGHLKEHVYAVPPRTIKDLVAGLEAAVSTVDVNTLRRVLEYAVPWTDATSNTNCKYEAPIV